MDPSMLYMPSTHMSILRHGRCVRGWPSTTARRRVRSKSFISARDCERHARTKHANTTRRAIVLEHGDFGAGQAGPEHQGRVVEFVAHNEAALAHEDGNVGGVCRKAHAKGKGRGLAKKLREERLERVVQLAGTKLTARGR